MTTYNTTLSFVMSSSGSSFELSFGLKCKGFVEKGRGGDVTVLLGVSQIKLVFIYRSHATVTNSGAIKSNQRNIGLLLCSLCDLEETTAQI